MEDSPLIVLSPFPAWAWPTVWQWMQTFRDRVMDDFAPASVGEFNLQMTGAALPADTYAVWRGEELGGLIWLPRLSPIVAFSHVLFKRSFWGHATTLVAVRAAYRAAFESGVEKIISSTFVDNHQVRAFAKQLGYVEEGRRRKQTRRRGVPVDMLDFGLLLEDFDAACSGNYGVGNGGECGSGRPVESRQEQRADVHSPADGDADAGGGHPVKEAGEPG